MQAEESALALLAEAGDGSMRDALSIMDQAIASAPCEADRPSLFAAQIRELMGTVPNAVFEKLLEAVAAGQSAELMEQLNVLINAGHSPPSLARQLVRYLRNTLMAKLGGEQTELLEISADERARAARTALLFTEEELTRNLQIVLRAFDDLNYRQEQRFHLELAMLKLIHAQRLLPLEELLSAAGQSAGVRSASPAGSPRIASGSGRTSASVPVPAAPAHSPFVASDSSRSAAPKVARDTSAPPAQAQSASTATVAAELESSSKATETLAAAPNRVSGNGPIDSTQEEAVRGSGPVTPDEAGVVSLRQAVCAALEQAGHSSAAQLLCAGRWSLDGAMVRIEIAAMGKKMLSLTINSAAEKIIRETLIGQSAPSRFFIVPGEADAATAQQATPAAAKGGVQEAALANPMVQRAKEILHAEVRSVVDLREK